MEKYEAKVWIVVNAKNRRYPEVYTRRVDAKVQHADAFHGCGTDSPDGKSMNPEQEAAWAKCVEAGDKLVRATLSWEI